VFCALHFLGFNFHRQSTMNVDIEFLFMNGMTKDGEGFFKFVIDYGVGIGEARGLGVVMVGSNLKQIPHKYILVELNENGLEILEIEVDA
jgi:hypothetical protein